MMALVYFLFFGVNLEIHFTYLGLQTFFAVLERLSEVFEMEENECHRMTYIKNSEEVGISIKDAAFTWGFRVKEDQLANKAS